MIVFYIKGRLGRVYVCDEDGKCLVDKKYPDMTDNQCEWKALVDALQYILDEYGDSDRVFTIYLDSKLVFKQIMSKVGSEYDGKTYSIKSQTLHSIYLEWNRLKNLLWDTTIKYLYIDSLKNIARSYLEKCMQK